MKIQPAQLPGQLRKRLAPVYLVSGDEPLLVQECCDQIRQAARQAGFQERLTFHADPQFSWNTVADECNAMSLFAEKRRIEIHLPKGKLGDGRAVMERILEQPPEETIILLISGKLDAAETRRKWYKALLGKGIHIAVWPIDAEHFRNWLQERASRHGLQLTQGALEMLAERLEGNLLAASQELDRLSLLCDDHTIDEDTIEQAVQDSARFSGFELVSEMLAGHGPHASRIISVLQQEGENPLGLLAVLSRDLGLIAEIQIHRPGNPGAFLKKRGVFQPQRLRTLERAARRLSRHQVQEALHLCSQTDRAAKGFGELPPWHYLRDLTSLLATRT